MESSAHSIAVSEAKYITPIAPHVMAALYWLMGYPQAKLVDWIHHRFRVAE